MKNSQSKYGLIDEIVSYCRHLLRWHYLKSTNVFWLRLCACCTPSRKNTLLTGAELRPFPLQQRCSLSFLQSAFYECSFLILLQACWPRRGNRYINQPVLLWILYTSRDLLNTSELVPGGRLGRKALLAPRDW